VWFVGLVEFLSPGERPVVLPPAPNPQTGWADLPYSYTWSMQVGYYVQTHARNWRFVTPPMENTNPLENKLLLVVDGWTG
jgi:hypothetical protein